MLAQRVLGYSLDDAPAAIRAFHRHYRGLENTSEVLDAEDARILHALQGISMGRGRP